ncbi:coiled-coil domain-containing protein 103-like [Lineus longissimus]|uniref:coiled-coil domain-containing protein 103-like n=1 Tax=Lineus longissimus TaxID=88925 RepID=UPI002B4D1762
MASKDEDRIDFDKLELELNAAVEADSKYWRENDAKFRALDQKVGSYEEFRDIVLASHIKPLDKGDKIQEHFNQPWNIAAAKRLGSDSGKDAALIKQDSHLPKTNQELMRDWGRYCKTAEERYSLLSKLGCENLRKIFKTGIEILGDIFDLFHKYEKTDVQFCLELLETLTKAERFGLSLDFLSKDEKASCKKMFEKLRGIVEKDQLDTQAKRIEELEKLYEIS